MTKWSRFLGVALILLGVIGFLTVADDLRHTGELLGVSAVLVSGVVLAAISVRKPRP
jgi:drug/metabolite transporter (DMT)-like permease